MQTMRNASQPHRMRQVDVYHVTSEPRHVLQTHGDPLYSGSVRLSGRLELPPIAIPSCAPHEWIIVQAAELSDDRYDGWRNAPCPQPDGVVVGSDGSGPGWERSERGAPERDFPPEPMPEPMPEPDPCDRPGVICEPPDPCELNPELCARRMRIQMSVDRVIQDAGGLKQGGDSVHVRYETLFDDPDAQVDSDTVRVSTNPPNIVGTTVRNTGIDLEPERPGMAMVTVTGPPSLQDAVFNAEVEEGDDLPNNGIPANIRTRCIEVRWLDAFQGTVRDNRGVRTADGILGIFSFEVANTCQEQIRVFMEWNNYVEGVFSGSSETRWNPIDEIRTDFNAAVAPPFGGSTVLTIMAGNSVKRCEDWARYSTPACWPFEVIRLRSGSASTSDETLFTPPEVRYCADTTLNVDRRAGRAFFNGCAAQRDPGTGSLYSFSELVPGIVQGRARREGVEIDGVGPNKDGSDRPGGIR